MSLRCYAIRAVRNDGTVKEEWFPSIRNDAGAKREAKRQAALAAYTEATAGIIDTATNRFIRIARYIQIGDGRVREAA